jgi:thiol-disulfide isomerase/thioredoxin
MAESNYKMLAEKHPGHPYISLIGNIIEGRKNTRIGGRFIDFSAPDLNGQMIKLSDIIEGKVALLDLWSSWCSSCIAYSRTLIPVYNEFKRNDFIIVGVSADKNATRLFNLNKRENYPWINLVEINNQNKIWEKYNIINAGGKAFLIDKNGIVIAIQPTANELRDILSKVLQ